MRRLSVSATSRFNLALTRFSEYALIRIAARRAVSCTQSTALPALPTLIGDTFQNRGGGLGFAPDGTLYFAEFDQLHTLDTATGAPLTTINLTFGGHEGLAIRPSDGTLFASQAGAGPANDGIRIIDPITGISTPLGNTGAGNASDLAFRVETVNAAGPDVDEYLLDLSGKAGQPIDIAFSTDVIGEVSDGELDLAIILSADPQTAPAAQLQATGFFDSITVIDVRSVTPTLAQLAEYETILAYTNFVPADAIALGDTLADYVDAGGHLAMATYAYSNPWDIEGRITTTGYAPLTNVAVNGTVSGNLVATLPGDPIFAGIDVNAVSYFNNLNFAHPGLMPGQPCWQRTVPATT